MSQPSQPARGAGGSDATTPAVTPSGDVYTMEEAARLKGVSYHTVSRAVRRGKLPAQRLGRMALIAEEDLRAWRPMRERAPRKYRRREPNPDATPALLDLASGERVELARRLSALYEVLHGASTALPLPEFLALLSDRMGSALDFRRVMILGLDEGSKTGNQLAVYGPPFGGFPTELTSFDWNHLGGILDLREAITIADVATSDLAQLGALEGITSLFVAPLRLGERLLGFVFGDCQGESFTLSAAQLGLAQGMANQAALALEQARLRAAERTRADELAAILDNISEAVFACDALGRITLMNAAVRDLLGLGTAPLDLDRNVLDGATLTNEGDLASRRIGLDETPMLRALAGEHVRDREYAIATADGGPTRAISVNAQPIYNHDHSQIVGAVAVAHDVTAERSAAKQEAERLAQLQAIADRAAALSELVLALNAETQLPAVLETAVARLTDALGGASGAIYLRETDGRLVGQVGYRASGSPIAGSTIDLIASPATMAAFTRREPLVVGADAATPAERATLDRLGAEAMTIAPLIANAEPIGVAYVATDADGGPTEPEEFAFIASLAAQCAAAIDKGRFVDRLEAAQERMLAVLDQVPQAIVVADAPTGRLSLANRAATALLAAADGLPGTAAEVGFVTEGGAPYPTGDSPLERTLRTGEPSRRVMVTIARGDGSIQTVLADHLALRDDDGRLVGVVGVFQERD